MIPSLGNVNTIPQNQNTSATPTIEQHANVDIPGPSQPPGVQLTFTQTNENPSDDISEEIQRHVDLILERDRLVREEHGRLNAEVARESHYTEDSPYTPIYTLLYRSSMFPQYGDSRTDSYRPSVVLQTVPQVDLNTTLLQELLANQKREFDKFKQTVLASLLGRANRSVPHTIIPFTARLNVVPIPT
ncbi:hypothetical protein LIER_29738 [Lithospermum erythrorhizon]|uniref:Uncharacterized protein n=1 Tax=Lithospermum erythrorhizon TaxID=34254 RepID=A0AAV3RP68_LITER